MTAVLGVTLLVLVLKNVSATVAEPSNRDTGFLLMIYQAADQHTESPDTAGSDGNVYQALSDHDEGGSDQALSEHDEGGPDQALSDHDDGGPEPVAGSGCQDKTPSYCSRVNEDQLHRCATKHRIAVKCCLTCQRYFASLT